MKYIPNNQQQEAEILKTLGVGNFNELLTNIPEDLLKACNIDLPEPLSDLEINKHMNSMAGKNANTVENISFLGGGAYDHFVPAVVDYLISRSEFYTAYTPYQPEVSQGTLQSIYEYQSLICQLTDMEIANASMYDGATALAEAAMLSMAQNRKNKVLVSPLINPASMEVLCTYLKNRGGEIELLPEIEGKTDLSGIEDKLNDVAAVLVQTPNFLGNIESLNNLKEKLEDKKVHLVLSVDPISSAILKTPGELGADIAVAEGQPLGVHQSFGGPYLGIFTAKKSLARKMPGRIVGETEDVDGKRGYVLVLQTREQHIRREKATSNICTNQGLIALAATIYMALLGKNGLTNVAKLCLHNSHYLAEKIQALKGYELVYKNTEFFKEFVIKTPVDPDLIIKAGLEKNIFSGINLGKFRKDWQNQMLIAVTEKRNQQELDKYVEFLGTF